MDNVSTLNDITQGSIPVVIICGIKFQAKEFDMQTRGLWLTEVREHGLDDMQRKLQTEILPEVAVLPKSIENDPNVRSITSRYIKLQKKHEKLLEKYGTEEEPEGIDDELEAVVDRMAELSDKLHEAGKPKTSSAINVARDGEKFISEFMRIQDEARLKFAWRIATVSGKTDVEFQDFQAKAKSADYDAAEDYVNAGNAGWVERMENRASRRATQKNQIGTQSTVKLLPQESPPKDLVN